MTFWLLAFSITALAAAVLYYGAAGRRVNAAVASEDPVHGHFRAHLREIDGDLAAGRLGAAEAEAAKGELAREMLLHKAVHKAALPSGKPTGRSAIGLALVAIIGVAFASYLYLGHPELPSEPLASRDTSATGLDLDAAIKTIETRLAQSPDDLRGWRVIAPAYMQTGRYSDAARAYRRILELAPPTADTETDLGEALMMLSGGAVAGEPLAQFNSAAARDPSHARSRYYIAAEATRAGDYAAAVEAWTALLALAKGDEPWVVTARNGLAIATAGLEPQPSQPPPDNAEIDNAQINAMVDGLNARLMSQGGSIEEWTMLVRSRMMQGDFEAAQSAYDLARTAYPDARVRTELDVLAADHGLVASKGQGVVQ